MTTLAEASPADIIQEYILTRIQPSDLTGWAWYIGKLPPAPDKVIALIDQGGPAGIPNLLVDFPGLQVLVRGGVGAAGYKDSWLMIRKIRDSILGMQNAPPEFPELDGITERGTIVPMGYDDKDRHIWSSNYQLIVEPGTNAITHRSSL